MRTQESVLEQDKVVMSDNLESGRFQIKGSAAAFEILSTSLYTNNILAIVRETICNAFDSVRSVGKDETSVTVHIPTYLEPYYEVSDEGAGLDHKGVVELYTTYFGTSKDSDDNNIGGFGLGAKTPFSYVDAFTIVARDGVTQRTYSCYRDDDGFPCLTLLDNVPTIRTGLSVNVPVKDGESYRFRNAFNECCRGWDKLPNVNVDIEGTPTWENYDHGYGVIVRMGGVVYQIQVDKLGEGVDERWDEFPAKMFKFTVPIGTVQPTPSREALNLRGKTTKVLVELINNRTKELVEASTKIIEDTLVVDSLTKNMIGIKAGATIEDVVKCYEVPSKIRVHQLKGSIPCSWFGNYYVLDDTALTPEQPLKNYMAHGGTRWRNYTWENSELAKGTKGILRLSNLQHLLQFPDQDLLVRMMIDKAPRISYDDCLDVTRKVFGIGTVSEDEDEDNNVVKVKGKGNKSKKIEIPYRMERMSDDSVCPWTVKTGVGSGIDVSKVISDGGFIVVSGTSEVSHIPDIRSLRLMCMVYSVDPSKIVFILAQNTYARRIELLKSKYPETILTPATLHKTFKPEAKKTIRNVILRWRCDSVNKINPFVTKSRACRVIKHLQDKVVGLYKCPDGFSTVDLRHLDADYTKYYKTGMVVEVCEGVQLMTKTLMLLNKYNMPDDIEIAGELVDKEISMLRSKVKKGTATFKEKASLIRLDYINSAEDRIKKLNDEEDVTND